MESYSPECCRRIVKRFTRYLARKVSPVNTLYGWQSQAGIPALSVANDGQRQVEWAQDARLAVLVETAPISAHAVAEYCHRKGLYPEQIQQWKNEFMQPGQREERALIKKQQKEIQQCSRKIARKDKTLAEAAALLILEKSGRRSSTKNARSNNARFRQVTADDDVGGGCRRRYPIKRSVPMCGHQRTDVSALAVKS